MGGCAHPRLASLVLPLTWVSRPAGKGLLVLPVPSLLVWHRGGHRHTLPLPDFYVYRPLLS